MRYAGWIVSYEVSGTNKTQFSDIYSIVDDAKKFAKEQRDYNAKNIKIYHLVIDNQQQII